MIRYVWSDIVTLFEHIYRHKVIITSTLWIIFVLTIVLNMVFNIGIYNYDYTDDMNLENIK